MAKPSRRFFSLWAINGPLNQRRLTAQLDGFRQFGLDGVVFHPRTYPGSPPYLGDDYLRVLSQTILHAKKVGLAFWIYDENGWPSGTADGELFRSRPGDVCQRLDLLPGRHADAVISFSLSSEGCLTTASDPSQEPWSLVPKRIRGLDCLNPQACRNFLHQVHERYRTGLDPEAFEHIEAFFTDEPEFGLSWDPMPEHAAVPWSFLMAEALAEAFGPAFAGKLPLLFFPGEGAADFRVQFWERATDLFLRGFFDPYRQWCERWGKRFVGHVKGEEHPLFQLPMVGSCQRIYRGFSLPGIDALERLPSNNFFPTQAASVAWQFGSGQCLAECFGGAGWGAEPADLERYLLWLGRQGITDFVLHLSQYELRSDAIRDWPPSMPFHLNWHEAFPGMLDQVRRKLDEAPPAEVRLLVLTPIRGIMAAYEPRELMQTNIHNAAVYPNSAAGEINRNFLALVESLHEARESFHLCDERTFEEAAVEEAGGIRVGNCRYETVLLPDGALPGEKATRLAIPPPRPVPSPPFVSKPASTGKSLSVPPWGLTSPVFNSLLLECRTVSARGRSTVFETDLSARNLPVSIRFADAVSEVFLNDFPLEILENEGWSVEVSPGRLRKTNHLYFILRENVPLPFVWVEGEFLVLSRTPYFPASPHLLATEGPFYLSALTEHLPDNLIAGGFPFLRRPLIAETAAMWPGPEFRFDGIACAAAALIVPDGRKLWTWGPDWSLALPPDAIQEQTIRLEIIPSAFNHFGPHHYYRGDADLISPAQFAGQKNFADPPGAPDHTLVSSWHFRHLRFPQGWTVG